MDSKALKQRALYVTRHGSHAYGLNTPESDLDVKGVFVGDKRHYMGFVHRVEQLEEREPHDLVIYELTKFFRLAADCNPNIVEVLWTADEDILFINTFGRELRDAQYAFLSQKAKHTFSGYAMAQLKRMKNHHQWMANPPQAPKSRADLGLPQNKNWCDWIEKLEPHERAVDLTDEFRATYDIELQWREASKQWAHYQEWLKGRNPKRHALEARFGYDTKHGMHLVRLMRMGKEILETGKVIVKRPDREELLAIRNAGIWSYEQIVEYAEKMDAELTAFYASGKSPLPKEPNRVLLDNLCTQLVEEAVYDFSGEQVSGNQWDGPAALWDGKV
jgi:hypothetical protein